MPNDFLRTLRRQATMYQRAFDRQRKQSRRARQDAERQAAAMTPGAIIRMRQMEERLARSAARKAARAKKAAEWDARAAAKSRP